MRHSQTVLNQLRYPSVLLLVCQDSEQNKPDIHFFYCDEVEAELVHEDIESALADCRLGKKMRPQTLKGHQEKIRQRLSVLPAPQSPAPIPFQRYAANASPPKNRVGPPVPLSEPGFRRQESLDEEPPRAVLAQKIEKETVGLRGWQVPPQPTPTPPPGQEPRGSAWGCPCRRWRGCLADPCPSRTLANPQLRPGRH